MSNANDQRDKYTKTKQKEYYSKKNTGALTLFLICINVVLLTIFCVSCSDIAKISPTAYKIIFTATPTSVVTATPAPTQAPGQAVVSELTRELGIALPQADDFLTEEGRAQIEGGATVRLGNIIDGIDINSVGEYAVAVVITKDGQSKTSIVTLKYRDTTAPTAQAVSQSVFVNNKLSAESFVENIVDITKVTVGFEREPDFTVAGTFEVVILLTDTSGNIGKVKAELTVKADTEPPVISGVVDRQIYIGDTVSYKKGITVTDDSGLPVELVVDNSAVNVAVEGSYYVIYSATDASGNRTEKKALFSVAQKSDDYVDESVVIKLADNVLAEIITDDMTAYDKVTAIYRWIKGTDAGYTNRHLYYRHTSIKGDWMMAAYRGFTTTYGDCFVYYSVSQILLTRAGIENMRIVRTDGGHYWNLVNCGDGWYHFDTTPRSAGGEFLMVTDAQIKSYSDIHGNSHKYDQSLYPETPTVELNMQPW